MLHCTILCWTKLYCYVLHCTMLKCTILYCTVLYYAVLQCNITTKMSEVILCYSGTKVPCSSNSIMLFMRNSPRYFLIYFFSIWYICSYEDQSTSQIHLIYCIYCINQSLYLHYITNIIVFPRFHFRNSETLVRIPSLLLALWGSHGSNVHVCGVAQKKLL